MPPKTEKKSKPNTFPESMSLDERIQYCQDMLAVRAEMKSNNTLRPGIMSLVKSGDRPIWPRRGNTYDKKEDRVGKLFDKKMKLYIQEAYYQEAAYKNPKLRNLINENRKYQSIGYYVKQHWSSLFLLLKMLRYPLNGLKRAHEYKLELIKTEIQQELGYGKEWNETVMPSGNDSMLRSTTATKDDLETLKGTNNGQRGSRPLPELDLLPRQQTEAQKAELQKAQDENQLTQQIMDPVSLYDDPELEMELLDKLVYETKMQYFLDKNILQDGVKIDEIMTAMPDGLGNLPTNIQSLKTQVQYYQERKQHNSVNPIPPDVKDAIKGDESVKIIRDNTPVPIYDSTDQSTTLVTSKKEADSYLNQVNEDLQQAAQNVGVDLKKVGNDLGMKMKLYKEIFQPNKPENRVTNLAKKGMFDRNIGKEGMDRLKLHFLETYSVDGMGISPGNMKEKLRDEIAGRNSGIKNIEPPPTHANATDLLAIANKLKNMKKDNKKYTAQ